MRFLGFEIRKAAPAVSSTVPSPSRGWYPLVRDWFAGAWQRNQEWSTETVLAHHAVYACVTLIANDVGKLRPKLVERDENGIWSEVTTPSPLAGPLRKPNRYQNRIQFFEWWITSKLLRGNTYVLKERDGRGVVQRLHLLDPSRVQVLVATDGSVFYQISQDDLAGVPEASVAVPASEIIHDRMNCLFHPLVGVSPIFASGIAANIGLKIQQNSAHFFGNGSNPSGILSAPTSITPEKSRQISEIWQEQFGGDNAGKIAVLGDDLKFSPMRMTAVDSQMIEQLKWTAETVCSTFHVPAFKLGIGQMPTYQNGEILNAIYYSDCLQSLIEQLELCLDEGLGLTEPKDGRMLGVELDLDALLRMDSATQVKTLAEGVGGGIYAPNEARRKLDLKPVEGGDTPYLQEQNWALGRLAERPAPTRPASEMAPNPAPAATPNDAEERAAGLMMLSVKSWGMAA